MYEAVVMGGSAGSISVMTRLLSDLPKGYPLPVIIVVHLHPTDNGKLAQLLDSQVAIGVRQAEEKMPIAPGKVYIAPAGYHLLVEHDKTFSLTADERVSFARPSIDVLFESAAFVYGQHLAGILTSGANHDGARGIRTIKRHGGLTIVQDPSTAEHPVMPQAAVDTGCTDRFLTPLTWVEILR